jgi:hypothetical protein
MKPATTFSKGITGIATVSMTSPISPATINL